MPVTLGLLALGAKVLFPALSWAEAFLLAAVLTPTDPVVTSTVVTAQRVPAKIRHTLNLESGLNDGLALPFVLFFLVLARDRRGCRPEALELLGRGGVRRPRRRRARHRSGGGCTTASPAAGSRTATRAIYAIGIGLAAFGLADVTFGNGLIAAFVAGIALGAAEHEIPDAFVEFTENVSAIFQVMTFFVFGALIVATGYDGDDLALLAFIPFALLVARPVAVMGALAGSGMPRPQKLFIAWFGPKGVASMLFALLRPRRGRRERLARSSTSRRS